MDLKYFDLKAILDMDDMFRRYFMNTAEGFKNAALLGTANSDGLTNLAIFNSVVHIGASPPLIGFIHRPVTVPKQTFTNIQQTGSFTINLITKGIYKKAHQTSARYAPDISEFEATDLQAEFGRKVKAPYVAESPVRFGMSLEEIIPIRSNGTYLVIGKVQEMFIRKDLIADDGNVELHKADIIAVSGLDNYYLPELIERLPYAKVPATT
ncbi:flavin reductase family protein [Fulvivirga sedimenti]|uniref:Flavin reductase family protein n=1 Tax=Fulvivirga sedimenti TaxID=2879465 RepID=A0A9X1HK74_9BACT|nr:flavin reductase family protein [Fulvivirga sedimenti]MCA6073704.1 flavin reductase family protein [Fulvivirga sedimenti]